MLPRSSPISCCAGSTFIRRPAARARRSSSWSWSSCRGSRRRRRYWENEILPRRVKDYRPAWLDEVLGRATWLWRAEGTARATSRASPSSSATSRDVRQASRHRSSSRPTNRRVLELLERHGASFATDLARLAGIEPSRVRRALRELMGRGLVTNDRFDPLRPGSRVDSARTHRGRVDAPRGPLAPHPAAAVARRRRPEGRWSRLDRPAGDPESRLLAWAGVLLERYGVLTREVVALEAVGALLGASSPRSWHGRNGAASSAAVISSKALGVQYASEEAAAELGPARGRGLDGLPRPWSSYLHDRSGEHLRGRCTAGCRAAGRRRRAAAAARRAISCPARGRPVLIIESYGKRLTGLAWASQADIDSALNLLPGLTGPDRRILKVETYNGVPAAESPAAGAAGGTGLRSRLSRHGLLRRLVDGVRRIVIARRPRPRDDSMAILDHRAQRCLTGAERWRRP